MQSGNLPSAEINVRAVLDLVSRKTEANFFLEFVVIMS